MVRQLPNFEKRVKEKRTAGLENEEWLIQRTDGEALKFLHMLKDPLSRPLATVAGKARGFTIAT